MNLAAASLDLSQICIEAHPQCSVVVSSVTVGGRPRAGLSSLPLAAFPLALPDSLPLISPHTAPNLCSPPLAPGSVSASSSILLLLLFLVLRDRPENPGLL